MTMRIPLLAAIALLIMVTAAAAQPLRAFPDLTISGPLTDAQKVYLGVDANPFRLSEIKADILFIEGYSMYCPICQQDAPVLNELFQRLDKADPEGKIRFIGLGLGNTEFETTFYQKKFNVPFPLFKDEDYAIHKALGEPVAPTYYIVRTSGPTPEMLYKAEGELAKDIFETIMTLAKTR
ncbi:MAG: redoxin domain-containing protein [Pseudomonadota bacterium]